MHGIRRCLVSLMLLLWKSGLLNVWSQRDRIKTSLTSDANIRTQPIITLLRAHIYVSPDRLSQSNHWIAWIYDIASWNEHHAVIPYHTRSDELNFVFLDHISLKERLSLNVIYFSSDLCCIQNRPSKMNNIDNEATFTWRGVSHQ